MARDHEAILKAASRLEDLLIAGKAIVYIMQNKNDEYAAYAMMYWLRREIGYVTRELGDGVPSAYRMQFVQDFVVPQIEESE